jgi:hypothetical protein
MTLYPVVSTKGMTLPASSIGESAVDENDCWFARGFV